MERPTRYPYVVILILGVALAGVASYGIARRPAPLVLSVLPPRPTAPPHPTFTAGPVCFYITGRVNEPGVYTLPPGARVQDAIQAAGGPSTDADLDHLNLAALIQDGAHISVPAAAQSPMLNRSIEINPDYTGFVNINTADSETLQALPGIGPVLAERIEAFREEHGPFQRVEDLEDVAGIGPQKLEQLRPLITVGH